MPLWVVVLRLLGRERLPLPVLIGVGADVVFGGLRRCTEKRGFDVVGVNRAGACGDQVVERGVGDGADAAGGDEPGKEVFHPRAQPVDEAVDDEAPRLSPDEEAGIEAALESYRQGRVVDAKRARQIIDAALGR